MQSSSQIVAISKLTPNFLQAECLSCRPTNSAEALKGKVIHLSRRLIPFSVTAVCCHVAKLLCAWATQPATASGAGNE